MTVRPDVDPAFNLPENVGGLGAAGESDVTGSTADEKGAGDLQDPDGVGGAVECELSKLNATLPLVETGGERQWSPMQVHEFGIRPSGSFNPRSLHVGDGEGHLRGSGLSVVRGVDSAIDGR